MHIKVFCCCYSVTKSCLTLCDSVDHTCQAPLFSALSQSLLKFMSIELVMLSSHLIFCYPLLLLPSIFSQHQGLFQWVSSYHQVTKVLELQHHPLQWIFRVDFLWDWLVWSCSPKDSQESSPAPQFKGINSSVLSLLYNSTLKSVRDY